MAAKAVKHAVETTTQPELATPDAIAFDLEEQIADELLDNIDWSKVRSALLKKAPVNTAHNFVRLGAPNKIATVAWVALIDSLMGFAFGVIA
jgi:hypothetical protein